MRPAAPPAAARVREHLLASDMTVQGLTARLGSQASAALGRGDPYPARRALRGERDPQALLARTFLLGEAAAGGLPGEYREVGLVDGARPLLDLRPLEGGAFAVSDRERGRLGAQHVLGVGGASLQLLAATPREPVGLAVDLGTGSGVQALALTAHAQRVIATDVSARALDLAALAFALSGRTAELRRGDLVAPLAGERADLLVANPPFVAGPDREVLAWRDGGAAGDALVERLVREVPAALAEGGVAVLLGSWLHRRGEPWWERVGGWLDGSGCDAWVTQREVLDPAEHAALWLGDAGSGGSGDEHDAWLDWAADGAIDAVGYGVLALRRRRDNGTGHLRTVEDDPAPVLGPSVSARLQAAGWLATVDDATLLGTSLVAAPGLRLESRAAHGGGGWEEAERWLVLDGGAVVTDEAVAAVVAGCDGTRPLGLLLAVLAAGTRQPVGAVSDAASPVVRDLVARALLLRDPTRSAASPPVGGTPGYPGSLP